MNRINQILQGLARPTVKTAPLSILLLAASAGSLPAFAQAVSAQVDASQWNGYAWSGGANAVVPPPPVSQATIPISTFTHKSSKDGKTYTSTIVGTSPFAPILSGNVINVVVVPIIVTVNTTTFDPTAADTCDSVPAQKRFYYSPLVNNVPNLTILGVNVGTTQFTNGFRRAEFWSAIGGGKGSAYQNTLSFAFPYLGGTVPFTGAFSGWTAPVTSQSGCTSVVGAVPPGGMKSFLEGSVIPTLQNWGVISPASFAIFLLRNVVQVKTLDKNGNPEKIDLGYHSFVANSQQTYAVVDWDTVNFFGQADASVASHEIADWMDDPLVSNAAPAWGGVGQVDPGKCQNDWETGDPLTKLMPAIKVPSDPFQFSYHMQELAYFGFFYNSPTDPSGAANFAKYLGGMFSTNGTLMGPANTCPIPGGVAPFQYGIGPPGPPSAQ